MYVRLHSFALSCTYVVFKLINKNKLKFRASANPNKLPHEKKKFSDIQI